LKLGWIYQSSLVIKDDIRVANGVSPFHLRKGDEPVSCFIRGKIVPKGEMTILPLIKQLTGFSPFSEFY
jgi:hypothetical protein